MDRTFAASDIRSRIPWVGDFYKQGLKKAFEAWKPLCEAHGCSYAALVEAWALAQYEKMSLLVGMRKPENVADTAGCVEIELSEQELREMEETVKDIQVEVLDK
jgi:methylglyoxal reductase